MPGSHRSWIRLPSGDYWADLGVAMTVGGALDITFRTSEAPTMPETRTRTPPRPRTRRRFTRLTIHNMDHAGRRLWDTDSEWVCNECQGGIYSPGRLLRPKLPMPACLHCGCRWERIVRTWSPRTSLRQRIDSSRWDRGDQIAWEWEIVRRTTYWPQSGREPTEVVYWSDAVCGAAQAPHAVDVWRKLRLIRRDESRYGTELCARARYPVMRAEYRADISGRGDPLPLPG